MSLPLVVRCPVCGVHLRQKRGDTKLRRHHRAQASSYSKRTRCSGSGRPIA